MLGERDGVGRRLGAAVDGDVQAPRGGLDEELGRAAALGNREQDALAGRAQREQPVEAGAREEVDERRERSLVERATAVPKRRGRGGERALDHRPLRREVLVVLDRAGPPSAPPPADRVERADERAAFHGHALPHRLPGDVRAARVVVHAAVLDVRVLDRVDVDRAAVRVLRPAARAGRAAAVERRRVVGLDRPEVAAAVGVDRDDLPDREPRGVQAPEHRPQRARRRLVDDEPAGAAPAVEPPVADRELPEVARARRGSPAATRPPSSVRAASPRAARSSRRTADRRRPCASPTASATSPQASSIDPRRSKSGRRDSNSRPLRPKRSALTRLSYVP